MQSVDYFIEKGVMGVSKRSEYPVLEQHGPAVAPGTVGTYDSTLEMPIRLPTVPPTLLGLCRLIQIYYILKARHIIGCSACFSCSYVASGVLGARAKWRRLVHRLPFHSGHSAPSEQCREPATH